MGNKVEVKFEAKLLNQLLKNLKKPGYVKVGILESGKNKRTPPPDKDKDPKKNNKPKKKEKLPTNADIGVVHEFGLEINVGKRKKIAMPERSFLRMPLYDDFEDRLFKNNSAQDLVEKLVEKPAKFFDKLGTTALGVIRDAFHNGGSSRTKWQSLDPEYAKTKNVNQILVETGQLRDSITHQVVGEFGGEND